jgi:hypothetical protein
MIAEYGNKQSVARVHADAETAAPVFKPLREDRRSFAFIGGLINFKTSDERR